MSIGGINFKLAVATGGRKFYAEIIANVFNPRMNLCNEDLYGIISATTPVIGSGDQPQCVFAWMPAR